MERDAIIENLQKEIESLKVSTKKEEKVFVPINDDKKVMNKEAIDLYMKNYLNEGMAENLPKMVKTIVKEFKTTNVTKHIEYLPWATIERIFRLQGGSIEVMDWTYKVEFTSNDYNVETGEIEEGTKEALFVHLRGSWKGVELDEFYPIFNNQTSRVVKNPDAQQLNSSRQRGSVRLIARLAGLGLWIFEQQEDEEGEPKGLIVPKKAKEEGVVEDKKIIESKPKKTKKDIEKEEKLNAKEEVKEDEKPKKKTKAGIAQEEKDEAMFDLLGGVVEEELQEDEDNVANMILGGVPTEDKKVKTPEVVEQTTYENGSEEHSDLILKLKQFVPKNKDRILEFRNEKGKSVLADLTYDELEEIIKELEM